MIYNPLLPLSPIILRIKHYTVYMPPARTLNTLVRSTLLRKPAPSAIKPSFITPTLLRAMSASAMSGRLQGKTIVITGASSGIGRSTAIEFARTAPKDLKLVLTARRLETLEEVAAEIKKEVGDGVKVLPFKLDVSKPEEVKTFVERLPEEFREIDVLVNNAYVTPGWPADIANDGIADWLRE